MLSKPFSLQDMRNESFGMVYCQLPMLLMILFQQGFVCCSFGHAGMSTERVCTPSRNLHA